MGLTAGEKEGYVKRYKMCVCENKANSVCPARGGGRQDMRRTPAGVTTSHLEPDASWHRHEGVCVRNKANFPEPG
jgi:hypothetical protein